eukprot:TRINITY_DN2112_c0_g1_i1.p1 TRINITY_DN2112_c0_g1~~TRINITY_DN2112_c0_g1_i1.p1  ORF type:complete len:425 (-),score=76.53 TRINITY_DN2112_c0_g1_i1:231-1505(-)
MFSPLLFLSLFFVPFFPHLISSDCPIFPQVNSFCSIPTVVGHRGIAYRPPHTLTGYEKSVDIGAEYVEVDLVSTKDSVLIALHDVEMSLSTDVPLHPEFASRKTTKNIQGQTETGWFPEDFTWNEIKTLRVYQYLENRSSDYDYLYPVPSLDSILQLVSNKVKELKRPIGVYLETKNPSYFQSIGLPLEPTLIQTLTRFNYSVNATYPFCQLAYDEQGRNIDLPEQYLLQVYIQSFETYNLRNLSLTTTLPLIQLISYANSSKQADTGKGWWELVTDEGLAEISEYAVGIGPNKLWIYDPANNGTASDLINRAHNFGLLVHPYTFKSDDQTNSGCSSPDREYRLFYSLGVDGVFSDFSDDAITGRTEWLASLHPSNTNDDDDDYFSEATRIAIIISTCSAGVLALVIAVIWFVRQVRRTVSYLG